VVGLLLVLFVVSSSQQKPNQETRTMKKLTPVIIVEQIEPCLPFWTDRLGFQKTAEVPEGNKLGFVMLNKDGVEVMYQTRKNVAGDAGVAAGPALSPRKGPINPSKDSLSLYIEVESLNAVIQKLKGTEVVLPERKNVLWST